jgi:hypothetical protein
VVKKKISEKNGKKRSFGKNQFTSNHYIDYECIELYNYVIKDNEKNFELRNGNWAQEFYSFTEAQIYIETQFSDKEFINNILKTVKNGR